MASHTLELPPTTQKHYGGKKASPGLIKLSDEEIYPVSNHHVSNHVTISTTPSPRARVNSGSKRGASGPIVTTSDEESDGCVSPRSSCNVSNLPTQKQPPCNKPSYEHDHDYENVSSPGGSSTASGPVYVRPPGFKFHAHEIKKTKKEKTSEHLMQFRTGLKKRAPTPPKVRLKKESVPMRLRALPQSFWKQPNVPNPMSPGNYMFPSLPPLCNKETGEDVTDVRPVTPPEEREARQKKLKQPDRTLIVGDTDLLLKHLFAGVTQSDEKKTQTKRGRPKKITIPKATGIKPLISGDDPYLVEAVTEKLFPQLTLENRQNPLLQGTTSLQLVTLREGDKCVTLPSLSVEQNYSQMLSELAMNI